MLVCGDSLHSNRETSNVTMSQENVRVIPFVIGITSPINFDHLNKSILFLINYLENFMNEYLIFYSIVYFNT